jgi:FHA domain
MELPISYDWTFLGLRVGFAGLLYYFLWQIGRIMMRDLRGASVQPSRKRQRAAKLIVIDPALSNLSAGASYAIRAKSTIGRHSDCSIAIEEPTLSAVHARFETRDSAWYVTDMDSTNGTFVNGRTVRGSVYIETDDIVQFGRMTFKLVA